MTLLPCLSQEMEVLEVLSSLLPAMEADGGGVELVAIEVSVVKVRLRGACLVCPSIGLTMKFGITQTIREKLPWVTEVIRVV